MSESGEELRRAMAGMLWEHFRGGTSITPLTTGDFDYLANRRNLTGDVNDVLEDFARRGILALDATRDALTVTAVLNPDALATEAGEVA